MDLEFLEKYRRRHPLNFPHSRGDYFGWFEIPSIKKGQTLFVMSNNMRSSSWSHVSVSKKTQIPSWNEMCYIKELFFGKNKTVVQFHPKEDDYINISKNCLHLWAWNDGTFPVPPKECV